MWNWKAAFADFCMNFHARSIKLVTKAHWKTKIPVVSCRTYLKEQKETVICHGFVDVSREIPSQGPMWATIQSLPCCSLLLKLNNNILPRELKPRLHNHFIKQEGWDVMHRRGMKWSSTGSLRRQLFFFETRRAGQGIKWETRLFILKVTSSPANHVRSFYIDMIISKRFP